MIKASYKLSDILKDAWREEFDNLSPLPPGIITVRDEELYKEKKRGK